MAGIADRLVQKMGYQRHKNTVFGRTNGIFFNVVLVDTTSVALYGAAGARMAQGGQPAMPVVRAYVKREGGIDLGGINAFLKKKWTGLKVYDAQADEVAVWMHINNAWTLKAENVEALLQEFSAYLVQSGYQSGCSFCSTTENLGYTEQDGRVMEVCDVCHEKLQGAVEEIKAQRETTGSYGKGAIGAVLGGIIGIIPWVLIGLLGYIAAISGLLMAWLSYKGYLLLGGKKGRGMVWILVIVLIVFTYVGVMTSEIVAYAVQGGYDLTSEAFIFMLTAPFSPEGGGFWGQIALGWLFAGLGSFGLIRKANKEASGKDLAVKRINKEQ